MNKNDHEQIQAAVRSILEVIGEDINDLGLIDTPSRVSRFWEEFIEYDPGNIGTTFEAIQTDQLIVVRNIKGYSLCEHHLLPFSFTAHVGYITNKRVIGLSKIPRIVQKHAHRLQLQERLTHDIAAELELLIEALGVGVLIRGQHTCMSMRGIQCGGDMVTSCLKGVLLANPAAKAEFLQLIQMGAA